MNVALDISTYDRLLGLFPFIGLTQCSTTCGQGVRRRDVKCFADSKEDPEEKWCKVEDKPESEEQCFQKECKGTLKLFCLIIHLTTYFEGKQTLSPKMAIDQRCNAMSR